MDLIPGLIDDMSKEMLNYFDGNTIHAISVVSKAWHVVVAKSIPDYISFHQCFEKAKIGHYLYAAKHLKLPDKKDKYLLDTIEKPALTLEILIRNSIFSGNIRMIKMLLTHFDVIKHQRHWTTEGVPLAFELEYFEIVEFLISLVRNKNLSHDLCNELLLYGACRKGDYAMFKTMLLTGVKLTNKNMNNITYFVGLGGSIEIFNEIKSHPNFSARRMVQGICHSEKLGMLEYIQNNSPLVDVEWIGRTRNIDIIKLLPELDLNQVIINACGVNNINVVTYILDKKIATTATLSRVFYIAWTFEYEELLYILLKYLTSNNFEIDLANKFLESNYLSAIKIYNKCMASFFSSRTHLFLKYKYGALNGPIFIL